MSKFRKLVDEAMKGNLDEVSPPGFKGTVKAMKKDGDIDNPFALGWWMKNKGYKSHKKASGADKENETLGGGKATDVSLTDARGSVGMGGQSEGEISPYAHTSDMHALAGDQARDEFTNEETGDNWSQTHGTGLTGMTDWVATDALPEIPSQYDMDITKLPESFDFSLLEYKQTLASEKGIKLVGIAKDDDGKKTKFMSEPKDAPRADYKELGAKDVKDADNLSDEAINNTMKNSAYETIRIDHVTKGKGTVLEIDVSCITVDWDRSSLRILGPERLPLSETKYLTRIKERYTDDPEDAEVDTKKTKIKGKKKMTKKKQKVDEAWISAIQSTMRMSGDGYKLPTIDLSPEDIGLVNEYELPDPGDSVLTGQDQQKAPSTEPLSTERGADAAHDDIYPDGDFATDLVPDDAPDVPSYSAMGDEGGNTRGVSASSERPSADVSSNSSGKSDDHKPEKTEFDGSGPTKKGTTDTRSSGDDGDYNKPDDSDDDSDDDDNEDKEMKEGLTWEDIGLDIMEVEGRVPDLMQYEETCEGCGDMDESHDPQAGEISMDAELIRTLLTAVRDQSPDDAKMDIICAGLEEASREKAATLMAGDISMIMDKIRAAVEGGGGEGEVDIEVDDNAEMAGPEEDSPSSIGGGDSEMGEEDGNEGGDARRRSQGRKNPDREGARDDGNNQKASKYHGKAWAHEDGDDEDDEDDENGENGDDEEYEDRAEGDGKPSGPEGGKEHEGKTNLMDRKGGESDDEDRQARSKEVKKNKQRRGERAEKSAKKYGESKGSKPISSNKSKGSGPGGGNTGNDGQDELIPAYPKGSQRGTSGTPLSKEGGGRTVKPVSESMVAMGMAAIGGTARNLEDRHDQEGLTEEQKELQMIRRRAGLENWWKVD